MAERLSPVEATEKQWPILTNLKPRPSLVQVALNRPVCVVGARGVVNLPLNSNEVSKAHTLIVQDSQGVYLRDLASRNHTYVNGKPVREVWLTDGDLLRIGPFGFRCQRHFPKPREIGSAQPAELWVAVDGLGSRQMVPIENQSFLIGTRKGCDLQLKPGADVASAHAVMYVRDGRRFIRDLSSPTGTFVNGIKIHETELADDTKIEIGRATLQYHAADPQMTLSDDSMADLNAVGDEYAADATPGTDEDWGSSGLLENPGFLQPTA